jgi:ABC-type cobalamin/Fe3+-siderophores transport system ATPase subunit
MVEGGSVWRIWDLHVHTPCSWLNNQYGDPSADATWETYVSRLEKACSERGVAALGVTDYFSIDGYKRLSRSQRKEGRLRDILLIPNVEFRINTIVYPCAKSETDRGPGRRINLHVLFDPSLSPEEIEEDFLHELKFIDQERTFEIGEKKVLDERNLRTFGEQHIAQDTRFNGRNALDVACSLAVVTEDAIKDALANHPAEFRGRALIVLAEENTSELAWGGAGHAIRQKLIQMSQAVFSSSESSRNFYLGKKHSSVDDFVKEFGSVKPCYWGSDAHSLEEPFLEPAGARYLWLKCDPCWEGLRQTLFEPEERVAIGPNPPKGAQSSYTLSRITIDCSQEAALPVRLQPQTIPLNRGLVAIIGGRGSGKTALLDFVASAFATGKEEVKKKESSFLHRIFAPGPTDNTSAMIGLTYSFVSGQEFQTSVGSGDWDVFEGADITYLQQNHFDSITGDPAQLKDQILKLVFDRFPEEDFAYKKLCQKTAMARQAIRDCNASINLASLEFAPMSQLVTERDLCSGRIADLERQLQLNEAESLQTSDQAMNDAVQRKVQVVQARSICESLLLRLVEATATARAVADKLNSFDWARVNADLLGLAAESSELNQLPAAATTEAVVVLIDQINCSTGSLTSLRKKLDEEFSEISKSTDSLDRHQKEIERIKLELQDSRNKLRDLDIRLDHMNEVKQKIGDLDVKLCEDYVSLVKAHADEQTCLTQLLTRLMSLPDTDVADLTFSAELTVDTSELSETVLSLVNKNLVDATRLGSTVTAMCTAAIDWATSPTDASKEESLQHSIGSVFGACGEKFKKGVTHQVFADALLDDHFSVHVQTGFRLVPVERLSMGQRAVVLLKLVLAGGDGPLLLDQPEEDLDNSYLYQELVPAIRRAKKRRQIVMATHNANLVLSADAEEVIIAHCDDCVIHYDIASLENLDNRDEITQVLEGGREAFELRERKYGIRF